MRKKYMVNLLVLNLSSDRLRQFINQPNCIAFNRPYNEKKKCILMEAEFSFQNHQEVVAWLKSQKKLMGPIAHEALRAIL